MRLGVARGAPELWVRLGRAVPYPMESIRSVTLVTEAGRLYLDVTAEVPVAIESAKPDRGTVAGIDLGIIHPYAVMAGDEALLVSGRQIRAEERLHLEDTKRRSQKAAARAPSKGQRGSRRWRRYRASRRRAEARHRRRVRPLRGSQRSRVDMRGINAGALDLPRVRRPGPGYLKAQSA